MTPTDIRKALVSIIQNMGENTEHYVREPGRDFCRRRKLPFETMLATILGMGGSSLTNELLDCFGCAEDIASTPAFIQQRAKILPRAFEALFQSFAQIKTGQYLYKNYQLLAIDGSDLLCAPNKTDPDSYFPGVNGQRPYNLLHLNALYDLLQHTYLDAVIQKRRCQNEHTALVDMVDRSPVQQAILLADRGFESYNNLAHIQEKGWKYLIRIKMENLGLYAVSICLILMNLIFSSRYCCSGEIQEKLKLFLKTKIDIDTSTIIPALTFFPLLPENMIRSSSMNFPSELSGSKSPTTLLRRSLQTLMQMTFHLKR